MADTVDIDKYVVFLSPKSPALDLTVSRPTFCFACLDGGGGLGDVKFCFVGGYLALDN
jgi:hypothetical protein